MSLNDAIAELREMNEDVPQPMRLPTADEVAAVEKSLGVQFHPHYRAFLLKASDVVLGALEPATLTDPDSHTYLPEVCRAAWEQMELPRELLPICEDNGDYYCMNQKGEVLFWSHDGASEEKWDSLSDWIEEVWIAEA